MTKINSYLIHFRKWNHTSSSSKQTSSGKHSALNSKLELKTAEFSEKHSALNSKLELKTANFKSSIMQIER